MKFANVTLPLPVGVYVLTADVPNPKRDKRCTRDWRNDAVFKAGLKIRLTSRPIQRESGEVALYRAEKFEGARYSLDLDVEDPRFQAMLPHLAPAADPIDLLDEQIRQLTGYDSFNAVAAEVLEALVRSGEVRPERVAAIAAKLRE
jgi:hypothetical protein